MSQKTIICQPETIKKEQLPTNTTTKYHSIHRWFNFIAGFSPEFVQECCSQLSFEPDFTLLDPFAGCGTALVEGSKLGIQCFGYEPHPIFFRIGKGKLPSTNALEKLDTIERILRQSLHPHFELCLLPESSRSFLGKLFDNEVLSSLLSARESLIINDFNEDDLAFLILSKVVDICSHSQTDGIYKAPTSKKIALSPDNALLKIIKIIREDLFFLHNNHFISSANIFNHSSENMSEISNNSISIIVTSPPYLNNFDYAEMTRMYLYFWGIANSWGEITDKVRSRLITNTTTALKGHKDKQELYQKSLSQFLLSELEPLVSSLANERKQRAGKKEYDLLVYPYFSQMKKIFQECHRVMKENAPIHIIIADAALYGVHISTPQYLAIILEEIGFKDIQCNLIRKRGHRWILQKRDGSKVGLGEYHIQGLK